MGIRHRRLLAEHRSLLHRAAQLGQLEVTMGLLDEALGRNEATGGVRVR